MQWSSRSSGDNLFNYNAYPRIHKKLVGGGALLLAKLISMASGSKIIAPDTENVTSCLPDDVLVSISELGKFRHTIDIIDRFVLYVTITLLNV